MPFYKLRFSRQYQGQFVYSIVFMNLNLIRSNFEFLNSTYLDSYVWFYVIVKSTFDFSKMFLDFICRSNGLYTITRPVSKTNTSVNLF